MFIPWWWNWGFGDNHFVLDKLLSSNPSKVGLVLWDFLRFKSIDPSLYHSDPSTHPQNLYTIPGLWGLTPFSIAITELLGLVHEVRKENKFIFVNKYRDWEVQSWTADFCWEPWHAWTGRNWKANEQGRVKETLGRERKRERDRETERDRKRDRDSSL